MNERIYYEIGKWFGRTDSYDKKTLDKKKFVQKDKNMA